MKPEAVKTILDNIITDVCKDPNKYVMHPGKDFTRDRKLPLETMLRIIIGMNGGSIKRELYDYDKSTNVTSSAFVQQRDKIRPEMFAHILRRFTDQLDHDKTYLGYRLLAIDGTGISLATNEEADTYVENGSLAGYNAFHMNALFDLCNKLYLYAIVEPQPKYSEPRAACTIVDRGSFGKAILMGDRGYASLNLLEHIHRKPELEYLIRVKNRWITETKEMPMNDIDTDVSFELRTTQRNEDKELYRTGKAKLIYGKSKRGEPKKIEQWDFENRHSMNLRIVRYKISDYGKDQYETIVTSLDRKQFPAPEIKKLYHMRWGIETSFRELKYDVGLTRLHTKKSQAAMQEIFARLIMYNFAQAITMAVVIEQKDDRKWSYQVNFTHAIYICKDYFRCHDPDPPDITSRIASEILPIRPDRVDRRKPANRKDFEWFLYRVA